MLNNNSNIKIVTIKAGICNCFLLIQNNSCLLVDTGVAGKSNKIIKAITSRGINVTALKYIFLTHTHYDHAGNVSELKKITGAKVITHAKEAVYLEKGYHHIPKGTSPFFKLIVGLGKINERSRAEFTPSSADIIFHNELDMRQYGFSATIYHSPGHTSGSSIIKVDDNILAGDSIFNFAGKIFPPFANEPETLLNTWKVLLDLGAKYYYPSHGKRISYSEFNQAYTKRNRNFKTSQIK